MTIVDNETLQPDKPPTPKLVHVKCGFCGGRKFVQRLYPSANGVPQYVRGKCSACAGLGYIVTEAAS